MDALATFLTERRSYDGPWNCSTMPADWCVAQGYADFAARWRTTLDHAACEQAAPKADDLLDLWRRDIGGGLPLTTAPHRGDIGVIQYGGLFAGAICAGAMWVVEGQRAQHFLDAGHVTVMGAWRV